MSLTLVTGPALEPVTLAEAKAHCRVSIADDDALLTGYILAAREFVERHTRRSIITQTWDYKPDQRGSCWPQHYDCWRKDWYSGIEIPLPPLVSVTSVSYVDSAGDSQTLAADQYQVVIRNGKSREGLIVPAYSVSWPSLRDQYDNVTVRFVAGYGGLESVPNAIRQAMLLLVGHWYESREAVVTGTIVANLPHAVEDLLFPLRVF